MAWNEAGLLSSASADVTNRTVDIALSGAKLATGLGTKAGLGAKDSKIESDPIPPCDIPTDNDKWMKPILWKEGGLLRETLVENYCAIPSATRITFTKDKNEKLLTEATKRYTLHIAPLINARSNILEIQKIPNSILWNYWPGLKLKSTND